MKREKAPTNKALHCPECGGEKFEKINNTPEVKCVSCGEIIDPDDLLEGENESSEN